MKNLMHTEDGASELVLLLAVLAIVLVVLLIFGVI
jgi:hypothetical protein